MNAQKMTFYDMPLIMNYSRSEVESLREGRRSGYTYKELSKTYGICAHRAAKYLRVYDLYGPYAFAKG